MAADTWQDCVCANPFLQVLGFPLSDVGRGEVLLKGGFHPRLQAAFQVS